MRYSYRAASFTLAVAVGMAVMPSAGLAEEPGLLTGHVRSSVEPLATATVYAYQVADSTTWKTNTTNSGAFFFDGLPAGMFKVIAYKPGFLPAVQVLRRATAHVRQVLDLELVPVVTDSGSSALSFWEVREQIPTDVLRDIERAVVDLTTPEYNAAPEGPATRFETKMAAIAGVEEGIDFGEAEVTGAAVGIRGQINDIKIDFNGRYAELGSAATLPTETIDPASGSSQQVSLRVQNGEGKGRSRFDVASRSNRLTTLQEGSPGEVDFERHRLSWSRAVGRTGRSDLTAQYTAENNYYRQALIGPTGIPTASRSWEVEGSYTGNLTERATIEAGMSYRERESDYHLTESGYLPRESVEVFGRGGVAVKPAVVVQYGLYSTLRDGSLSLAPQGGLALELGPNWRASTTFSRRIDSDPEEERRRDFVTAYFGDRAPCRQAEEYCYELLLSRLLGDRQTVAFGAVHRKIGETQRLYFSDDFFNRFDSLYLVEGDRLPELKFELTRRLAPAILARLRSNVAAGGGGLFYSTAETPYQNNVRYLVTSLDTEFEDTLTGVYLAFHRLEQELEPVAGTTTADGFHALELERLQLLLRQDLDILSNLANDWAVQLNMELSRGGVGAAGSLFDDELRKRVTGGLAVKF